MEKSELEVEGLGVRGDEEISVPRVYFDGKWGTERTDEK